MLLAYIAISSNGGRSWTTLKTLNPGHYRSGKKFTLKFDIERYASSNTRIKFRAVCGQGLADKA